MTTRRNAKKADAPPGPGELVIRVQATEDTLARIWALMLYAEAPFKMQKVVDAPLPWEEERQPAAAPKELDIDWEEVRRAVIKRLGAYVNKHGLGAGENILKKFGGNTLREIPQDNLMGLHDALA